MSYKVLRYFEDLQDNSHAYHPGDEFPRRGLKVSDERLSELSGKDNLRGIELIERKAETRRRRKAN